MGVDKWEIRTPGPPPGPYDPNMMPGVDTIGARRMDTRKTPTKQEPKSRWSIAKRALGLVPWGALIACSFLLTGLIIFLVHAKNAADRSLYVLQLSGSDPTGLYPHRVKVFSGSYAVTAGLASGCLVASIYLAVVRLRQKINAEKKRDRWGSVTFGFLYNFGILAFCAILLPTIWFTLNCVFLSAWGMGMYTLREAVTPASINMQQVDMSKMKITEPVAGQDGVCPSIGCFNMGYYVWLDSTSCLCTQPLIADLQDAARDAVYSVIWSLGGAGCLWFGALLAAAQGAADLALLKSVWRAAAKPSRPQPTPSKRAPLDEYAFTPGTALPKREIYPVNGNGYNGGGYFIRSPQPYM